MDENRNIIISAKDVEVKFRVRDRYLTAIRNVSLDLYEGETFAIVGESGSGKSVFTKTFTGMLESNGTISNGSVMFHGKDLTKLKTDKDWEGIRGAKISTIFQDPMTSLNPIRTIGSQITEVIEKHQGVSASEAKKQAIEMMERVGIKNAADRFDEYPFQYSGGMRQRIVIAIALSCHPEIDDPGADHLADPRSAEGTQVHHALHHARPRCRGQCGRPRRRHVRRPDHRIR